MAIEPGSNLGPYEITTLLGKGGMGEVYRARDTRLDRDVAIKVLPAAVSNDAERIARFEREAKTLATLSHPNIASIYGLERFGGVAALVMELIDGKTLAMRIAEGVLPIDESLDAARQMALALEAAHDRGIIHRDIKPANVTIASEGVVKVLDFGLAKAVAGREGASGSGLTDSPTLTAEFTRPGVVLGTAAYMSPEQARGKPVDKRTDVWSFGCVLYECLTGKAPFHGETTTDLLACILQVDPDFGALPANTPPIVIHTLRRCLEKDPRRRLRDMGDVAVELDEIIRSRAWSTSAIDAVDVPLPKQRSIGTRRFAWFVSALLTGLTLGVFGLRFVNDEIAAPTVRMSIVFPKDQKVWTPRLSPDGRMIAWVACPRGVSPAIDSERHLYIRKLDSFEVIKLPGSQGVQSDIRFSPNSAWIGFRIPVTLDASRSKLVKAPVSGGVAPLTLVEWKDNWDEWAFLPDDDIIILDRNDRKIQRLTAQGQSREETGELKWSWIGGITRFLESPREDVVLVQTYEWIDGAYRDGVAKIDLNENRVDKLIEQGSCARYAETGHLLYSRGETMLAAPFDLDRLELTGGPVPVASGLRTYYSYGHGLFDLADNGTAMFVPGGRVGAKRRIVAIRTNGVIEPISSELKPYQDDIAVSPDGSKFSVTVSDFSGKYEIWMGDVARGRLKQLTATANADRHLAIWSPDSSRLAFFQYSKQETDGIYILNVEASAEPALCLSRDDATWLTPMSWSPDGGTLLVARALGDKSEVVAVSVDRDMTNADEFKILRGSPNIRWNAILSPDGQWLLYSSDDTGRFEAYVCRLSDWDKPCHGTAISVDGGGVLRWSRDGKTAYYINNGRIWGVSVSADPSLTVAEPEPIFDLSPFELSGRVDLLPDGRVLAIREGEDEQEITHVNLVMNWLDELNQRVSAP